MDLIAHWLKSEPSLQQELHNAMLAMGQQLHETPEAEQWPLRQWRSWLEENSFDLQLLQQALQQLFANAGEAEPYAAICQELSHQPGDAPGIELLLGCAEHHSEQLVPQLLEELEAEAKETEGLLQTSGGSSNSHHKLAQNMSNHRAIWSTVGASIGAIGIYIIGKAGYKHYQEKAASDLFDKHHPQSIPSAAEDRFTDEENPFDPDAENISQEAKDMHKKYIETTDLFNYSPDTFSLMDNTALPTKTGTYSSISTIKKVDAITSETRTQIQDLIRWFPGRKNIHDQHKFWESITINPNASRGAFYKGRQPFSPGDPDLTEEFIDSYNLDIKLDRTKMNWYQDNIRKTHAHCKKLGGWIDNHQDRSGMQDLIKNLNPEDIRNLAANANKGEFLDLTKNTIIANERELITGAEGDLLGSSTRAVKSDLLSQSSEEISAMEESADEAFEGEIKEARHLAETAVAKEEMAATNNFDA